MSRRGWFLFLAVSTLWGLPYFLIRIAVRDLDPTSVVLGRTLPAALLLLPIAWRQGALSSLKGRVRWLVAYTIVEFGIPWYFMSSAERHISSSLASLLICATPIVSLGITKLLHPHDRIERRRLFGLALGSAGVIALVGLEMSVDSVWWIAAMGIVVLGYAGGPQIISAHLREANGLAVVATSVSIVAVLYLPVGIARWPHHVAAATWWSLAGLSGLCTIGAFLLFFALIKEVGPAKSTVVTYLNTAIAVVLGVVVLNEKLTTGILIGFPVIAAGSFLATAQRSSAASRPAN
jgi:drug/metabolite transporter (DMT)-like permease